MSHIAVEIARLGFCSSELIEVLTGSFISLFLFRRRLLSLLDVLFQVPRGRHPKDIVKLNGAARSELLLLSAVLPVACTNLRAPVSPRITATDASGWGEGAAQAPLPQRIADEVHRLVLRKPVWTKLLAPGRAWERIHDRLSSDLELSEGEESYKSNPLSKILAQVPEYAALFSAPASRPRHINVGELRSFLRAERDIGRRGGGACEIFGIDSQVTLGTLIKGRSSSRTLNRTLQQSIPNMIGYDIYSEGVYFETSRNRADAPSPENPVQGPSRQKPPWWHALAEGDSEMFDKWRAQIGIDDHALRGLPPEEELGGRRLLGKTGLAPRDSL